MEGSGGSVNTHRRMLTGTWRGLNLYRNPFFSQGIGTISFLSLVMFFGQLRVCTGLTLGVVEVDHRPKAIARVDKCVGADCLSLVVNRNIFNCDQLHFTILFNRYIVVLFLKGIFVSCVSRAAACLII